MMTDLEKYYNKFDEDHRLTTRHGQVEFTTTMKYIHDFLGHTPDDAPRTILDVGAGTGRYSIALAQEGHHVTAVELVERNRKVMESKHANVNIWPGNAMDLHFLPDAKFDITLLFGPLYHLHSHEERLKAFAEARRVTKPGGIIFAAYTMNEYSIITYCFKENHINECVADKSITTDFHTIESPSQLYTYFRLEDIDRLNKDAGLTRIKIFAADGPADYLRQTLNAMDDEAFAHFMEYHLATCERADLLGASSHTVDVLRN
jgi:ubiquinone/menaquinone biosynthesis C-methylase UbiE